MRKRNRLLRNRLLAKTQLFRIAGRLTTHYNLSLAASELLSREILDEMASASAESLSDGQVWYTAIHRDEPAGKSLKLCRKVRIKLTLYHPDDIAISETHALKSVLVHRLSWEAIRQEATLTVEDLAQLLFAGEKTIRRIIAEFRSSDTVIPIRGYYNDIGPGTSHKAQAIRLFVKGMMTTRIASLLGHHLHSIERYLNDFCLVMMGSDDGYGPARIARLCKLSVPLVTEYQTIYNTYRNDPDYSHRLQQLRTRLAFLIKKKECPKEAP